MTGFAEFDGYVRAREREYIDELKVLIRQPTVSAQGIGIPETARIVLDRTKQRGGITSELGGSLDHGPCQEKATPMMAANRCLRNPGL